MQGVRNKVESIVEAKTANFTASYALGIKDITSRTSFFENISFKSTMLFRVCVLKGKTFRSAYVLRVMLCAYSKIQTHGLQFIIILKTYHARVTEKFA